MSPAAAPLAFRIGNASGRVAADSPAFLDYAQKHLAPIVAPESGIVNAIDSQLRWHERPPRPRAELVPGLAAMDRPDRDLYVGDSRLAWFRIDDFRDLVLQAHWDHGRLEVAGDYHFFLNRSPWRDRFRRAWEARGLDHRREKRFATLLYYLVYYPAMWWHETQTGAHPLHAAAVAGERGALVLAGPSGVGKSTLTVALTVAGGIPLSETFVLHRGREVIAVPEPVLLDAWSRVWLGEAVEALDRAPGRFVFDRQGYHVGQPAQQAPAVALVLPRRGTPVGAAVITAAEAQRRISGGHQLIKDMRRYWAFAAALEKLAPEATPAGLMAAREAALGALTRDVPCWELRLSPDLSRAAATEMLADIAARSGGGGLVSSVKA